jgi:TonB family protein
MHELEKKALKDPFLAEALEGAEHAGIENFSLDLDIIQKSIRKKTKKRLPKIISINGWQVYSGIAAGLAFLAISSYILIAIIRQQERRYVAANKQVVVPAPALSDTSGSSSSDSLLSLNQPLAEETRSSAQTARRRADGRTGQQTTTDSPSYSYTERPAEIIATEGEIITHPNERIVEADLHEAPVIVRDSVNALQKNKAGAVADNKPIYAHVVRGKVTYSDDGSPLPGVNVLIKGTNTGTVTDLDGNYELPVKDANEELVFAFIGYSSQEVAVNNNKEINVSLDADVTQLSEVVVTGYSAKREREEEKTYPTLYFAEPSGGRKAYKKYLEEELNYPRQAIENKIEGRVTVQFTVEPNGQLSDFKVLKGLGHGCDDEVIRLIKQGPAWSPTKRNAQPVTDKVKVRLKFDLPDE